MFKFGLALIFVALAIFCASTGSPWAATINVITALIWALQVTAVRKVLALSGELIADTAWTWI